MKDGFVIVCRRCLPHYIAFCLLYTELLNVCCLALSLHIDCCVVIGSEVILLLSMLKSQLYFWNCFSCLL